MMDVLINYLSKYMTLSRDLLDQFRKSNIIKEYKKGSFLLRQGEIAQESFFILKGCVRSYTINNGEEKTIDFYIEEDPVLPLNYGQDVASVHFLECLEDTVAVVSSEEKEEKIISEFPQLKEVCRTLSEVMYEKIQKKFTDFKISTPEERYKLLLLNQPDLLRRIPQYQIAGYLGVKPESLSRIKKRLLNSKK